MLPQFSNCYVVSLYYQNSAHGYPFLTLHPSPIKVLLSYPISTLQTIIHQSAAQLSNFRIAYLTIKVLLSYLLATMHPSSINVLPSYLISMLFLSIINILPIVICF